MNSSDSKDKNINNGINKRSIVNNIGDVCNVIDSDDSDDSDDKRSNIDSDDKDTIFNKDDEGIVNVDKRVVILVLILLIMKNVI